MPNISSWIKEGFLAANAVPLWPTQLCRQGASWCRAFCRRFYNAHIGLRKSHFLNKVTKSIRADAKIWIQFLENYHNKSNCLIWSGPVKMLLTFTPTVAVSVVEVHFITTPDSNQVAGLLVVWSSKRHNISGASTNSCGYLVMAG